MGRRNSSAHARCPRCGYDLRGLLGPASEGRCPECAEEFNPYAPFVPEPARPAALVLLDMCWPTWVLASGAAAIAAMEPYALTLTLYMTLWLPWLGTFVAAGGWPLVRAWRAVRRGSREPTPLPHVAACVGLALGYNCAMLEIVGRWALATAL